MASLIRQTGRAEDQTWDYFTHVGRTTLYYLPNSGF